VSNMKLIGYALKGKQSGYVYLASISKTREDCYIQALALVNSKEDFNWFLNLVSVPVYEGDYE